MNNTYTMTAYFKQCQKYAIDTNGNPTKLMYETDNQELVGYQIEKNYGDTVDIVFQSTNKEETIDMYKELQNKQ